MMKKLELGQMINTLANIGVIAGIIFLSMELQHNNELLEMEARATQSEYFQHGWDTITSSPELVEIFIKDRNQQELTEGEEMRLSAFWMGYLIRLEFQFLHSPDAGLRTPALQRVHAAYPSFRRAWSGDTAGSKAAGKDNFEASFINYVETSVINAE